MAKPIEPPFRNEVVIIPPVRRRHPKKLRIITFFILVFLGFCYFMDFPFGPTKKCDLWIILTSDMCSKVGHDLGTRNNGGIPPRFHCLMKCPGKLNHEGRNSCKFLFVPKTKRIEYIKNMSPLIICEDSTNNVVTIIPGIMGIFPITVTLDLIKNGCNTIKKIVNQSPKHCGKDCMKMKYDLKYTHKNKDPPATTVELKKNMEQINSIAVIVKHLPVCVVLVNFNHMIFWSDTDRGTVETLNVDLNVRFTLVRNLIMPGSIAIDPDKKYLFWSNNRSDGSIGRIDFDGNNKIDITWDKYSLSYPSRLVVNRNDGKLYWTTGGIGNVNERDIVEDRKFYDSIGPDCMTISEHNVFWDKKAFDSRFQPTMTNFYFLLTHIKKNDVFKISANECNSMTIHCLHTCLRNPIGYHCICLDFDKETCQLDISGYLKNSTLSIVGYESITTKPLTLINKNILNMIGSTSFDYNLKTQKVYYYDATVKQIRVINMFYKTKMPILVVKNITTPANGLAYDWLTNNIYFIDSINRSIKVLGLNHYYPAPIVFAVENSTIDALEILPRHGLLVFICRDSVSKIIYKSTLNGTNIAIVAEMENGSSDSFIVDPHEHSIYWSNIKNNSITRLSLDGNRHDTYSLPKIYSYIMELNKNYNLSNISIDNLVGFQFNSKTNLPKMDNLKKCVNKKN